MHESHRVLLTNVSTYIIHFVIPRPFVPLNPHKLVQITWQLIGVHPSHPFELLFNSVPVAFNMLGVDLSVWVDKMQRMIDNPMPGYIWQLTNCSPMTMKNFTGNM
jgi:hypothetical protein